MEGICYADKYNQRLRYTVIERSRGGKQHGDTARIRPKILPETFRDRIIAQHSIMTHMTRLSSTNERSKLAPLGHSGARHT